MTPELKEILAEYRKIRDDSFSDFSEIFYRAHFNSITLEHMEKLNRILIDCRKLEIKVCKILTREVAQKDIESRLAAIEKLPNVYHTRMMRNMIVSLSIVLSQGYEILVVLHKKGERNA